MNKEQVQEIRSNPELLGQYVDSLVQSVVDGDTESQREVGILLKDLAETAPDVLHSHPEVLHAVITASDPVTKQAGSSALVTLTNHNPDRYTGFAEEITSSLLDGECSQTTEMNALRALETLAVDSDVSLARWDKIFAELLRDGGEMTRQEVLETISPRVIDSPDEFPETRKAIREAISDNHPDVQLGAMRTLALLIAENPAYKSEYPNLETDIRDLRGYTGIPDSDIEKALQMIGDAGPKPTGKQG